LVCVQSAEWVAEWAAEWAAEWVAEWECAMHLATLAPKTTAATTTAVAQPQRQCSFDFLAAVHQLRSTPSTFRLAKPRKKASEGLQSDLAQRRQALGSTSAIKKQRLMV